MDAREGGENASALNHCRPCPFTSCRHHLLLDVSKAGSLLLVRDEIEQLEVTTEEGETLGASCSLDLADRGALKLREIGDVMGWSRERSRQIEELALESLRGARGADVLAEALAGGGFEDSRGDRNTFADGNGRRGVGYFGEDDEEADDDAGEDDADASFRDRMWRAYMSRTEDRPHPLAELLTAHPWDAPGLDGEEIARLKREAVVAAWHELAGAANGKPALLDVARRAGLRGEGSKLSATTQSILRHAKAKGVDLPHFTHAPMTTFGRERRTSLNPRNAALVEAYRAAASEIGRRPSLTDVGKRAGATSTEVSNALNAARKLGMGIPFDDQRRRRRGDVAATEAPQQQPPPAAPAETKETRVGNTVSKERVEKVHEAYLAMVERHGRRPTGAEIAKEAGICEGSTDNVRAAIVNKALRQLVAAGRPLPRYEEGPRTGPKPRDRDTNKPAKQEERPAARQLIGVDMGLGDSTVVFVPPPNADPFQAALLAKRARLVEELRAVDVLLGAGAA